MRKLVKSLSPPLLFSLKRRLLNPKKELYSGNYNSWQKALDNSDGYNSDVILEKVRNSSLKVKNGEAVYERDSVLFDEIQYSWPLIAGLLRAASLNNQKLHVMDFGGALGSSYYQNRKLLRHIKDLKWCIVEQDKFYEIGKKEFDDDNLKFFRGIDECCANSNIDVILLSGVLPYLENPYLILKKLMDLKIKNIIIDRHPILTNGDSDILTVQNVPSGIYEASYPAWFFNKDKMMKFISAKYTIVEEFEGNDKVDYSCKFKGYILGSG